MRADDPRTCQAITGIAGCCACAASGHAAAATAEQRNELAPVVIESHAIPPRRAGPHQRDSELATINQRLVELFRTRQLLANAGRAVVLMIILLCQAQNPVGPAPSPAGFCFLGAEFAAITRPG